MALAWGWDITQAKPIASPAKHQQWHQYPVRFYKCALSAWLFGHADYVTSLRLLALHVARLHGPSALDAYIRDLFDLDSDLKK